MLLQTGSPSAASPVPRVSIVIPTLGGALVLDCLESLRRNIGPAIDYEVVVVANGPSAAHLASDLSVPGVRVVTAVANLGFGGG